MAGSLNRYDATEVVFLGFIKKTVRMSALKMKVMIIKSFLEVIMLLEYHYFVKDIQTKNHLALRGWLFALHRDCS